MELKDQTSEISVWNIFWAVFHLKEMQDMS